MTRRDHVVVGALVALLAALGVAIGLPEIRSGGAAATPSPSLLEARPYREGVLGSATTINPLAARTQADRDIVELVFSGLVRLGPAGRVVPDLASSWTLSPDGRTWTFRIRRDARWHDGRPVTAADVAFTVATLQDPEYTGPGAASWRDVRTTTLGERTVQFELETPLAGFVEAATQPIVPVHLLADVPVGQIGEAEFSRRPVGSGPFVLTSLDADRAILEPAALTTLKPGAGGGATARPTDSIATAPPTGRPEGAIPALWRIEFHFFDDPAALAGAYRAGKVDAASGLSSAAAAELATEPDTRLRRYPGSTLTAVAFNLRPDEPAFRDAAVRKALLQAVDRDALVADAFAGLAARADGPIPPASWAFDVAANGSVGYDPAAAEAGLEAAGWKRLDGGWALPNAESALELELLSPDEASNPSSYRAGEAVTRAWRRLGIAVTHVGLPAGEFVRERLRTADFSVAVVDVDIGLDPDLYPLLASTQATSHGSNVTGVQDGTLDKLLVAARSPADAPARRAAYSELEKYLAERLYLLPLAFRDVVVVVTDDLAGAAVHQVADPSDRFWDVLTWRLANDR